MNLANYATMDINILLSVINMKLRDEFSDLNALVRYFDIDQAGLEERLASLGYQYDNASNQFKAA